MTISSQAHTFELCSPSFVLLSLKNPESAPTISIPFLLMQEYGACVLRGIFKLGFVFILQSVW